MDRNLAIEAELREPDSIRQSAAVACLGEGNNPILSGLSPAGRVDVYTSGTGMLLQSIDPTETGLAFSAAVPDLHHECRNLLESKSRCHKRKQTQCKWMASGLISSFTPVIIIFHICGRLLSQAWKINITAVEKLNPPFCLIKYGGVYGLVFPKHACTMFRARLICLPVFDKKQLCREIKPCGWPGCRYSLLYLLQMRR